MLANNSTQHSVSRAGLRFRRGPASRLVSLCLCVWPAAVFAAPAGTGWAPPVGDFVSPDGKGFLAIRPGSRIYVRRDGEDRFTLYRTRVRSFVRNEYWLERVGDVSRTASVKTPPAAIAKSANKAGPENKPHPAHTKEEKTGWFARLFQKQADPAPAESLPKKEAPPEDEIEAKLATAWFSDSERLVFIFEADRLRVLIFDSETLTGKLQFRRIKFRLAVPNHAEG